MDDAGACGRRTLQDHSRGADAWEFAYVTLPRDNVLQCQGNSDPLSASHSCQGPRARRSSGPQEQLRCHKYCYNTVWAPITTGGLAWTLLCFFYAHRDVLCPAISSAVTCLGKMSEQKKKSHSDKLGRLDRTVV